MNAYTLKVESLVWETPDALTICFKQPGLKKVKYAAGQYLTIITRINGRRYIRPYSFSSSPLTDKTLNITIKRVPGGIVSNHILDTVKVNDLIEVFEPMGDFILDNNIQSERHLILWGSGSGVTPLMSLLKTALHNESYEHITLVYGNRNFESTIFAQQLDDLQRLHSDRFKVWHFHTKAVIAENNPYIIHSRIEVEKVAAVLKTEKWIDTTVHYICGPVGLKDSVTTALRSYGVKEDNIFTEDFEIIRDPKDFEDVFTQDVEITVEGNSKKVEVTKGKSILESGLDAMLELTYSCQTGSCLLCKATLISGEVKTIGLKVSNKVLGPSERLLCCSFPLTENVKLSVD